MTQLLKLSLLRSAIHLLEEKEKELVSLKNKESKRKASDELENPEKKKSKIEKNENENDLEENETRVLVSELSYEVQPSDIKSFFSSVASVVKVEILKRIDGQLTGCAVAKFASREDALKAESYIFHLLEKFGPVGASILGKRINVFAEATINAYKFPQIMIRGVADTAGPEDVRDFLMLHQTFFTIKSLRSIRPGKDKSDKFNGTVFVDVSSLTFKEFIKLKKSLDGTYWKGKTIEICVARQKERALSLSSQKPKKSTKTSSTSTTSTAMGEDCENKTIPYLKKAYLKNEKK